MTGRGSGPRFFIDAALGTGANITLPERAARHAKVLRLSVGDHLVLFDGSGDEFPSEVRAARRGRIEVTVGAAQPGVAPSPLQLHLGMAILKRDAMNAAMQKATELGVAAITPIFTEYTDAPRGSADRRTTNWGGVLASAAEQCGRATLPELHDPQSFTSVLQTPADLRLMPHPGVATSIGDLPGNPSRVFALIGPEGGFSSVEVDAACAEGFETVSLGPRVLRADTVPAALGALLQARWGDLA